VLRINLLMAKTGRNGLGSLKRLLGLFGHSVYIHQFSPLFTLPAWVWSSLIISVFLLEFCIHVPMTVLELCGEPIHNPFGDLPCEPLVICRESYNRKCTPGI
jgi:hypothetical protein